MAKREEFHKILPNNELEKRIIDAFEVFDHSGKQVVDMREIGTILRSLGCCPTEAEIQEVLLATENKEATGSIPLVNFLPYMCKQITDHRFHPASAEVLLAAFRFFDTEKKGHLSREKITKLMMEEGEPFTQEEFDEMMQTALDPASDTVPLRVLHKSVNAGLPAYLTTVRQLLTPKLTSIFGTHWIVIPENIYAKNMSFSSTSHPASCH